MMEYRLIDIPARNADLLAMFHIGDGTTADGLFHCLFDVITVSAQKPLSVHRALVLAVETSVDHIAHRPSGQLQVESSFKPHADDGRCEEADRSV
jgi:hypothetical protein